MLRLDKETDHHLSAQVGTTINAFAADEITGRESYVIMCD